MSEFDAAVESQDEELLQQQNDAGSSDDLRSALQASFREVEARQRDEQGRFAAKTGAEDATIVDKGATPPAAPAPAPRAAAPADQAAIDAAAAPAPFAATPRAPDAWSPAAKAKFATLDPEIQAEIARREAEVHKGFTKQDEQRNLGKSFEAAITPYLPLIRSFNTDPVSAVTNVMQTAHTLNAGSPDQKEQILIGLMQQHRIDPNRVFQRLAGGQQQRQIDPQVQALQQQVAELQRERQTQHSTAQSQEQAQIGQTIESFASDPKNVYFSNVRAEMAVLLNAGRAKDLEEAYDMACWARPDIRPLLLQQNDQQKQAEARAKAAKARAAGSSLTGSPTGSSSGAAPASSTGSLADDLRAVYREVMSRE
jgi:hypothetical protein